MRSNWEVIRPVKLKQENNNHRIGNENKNCINLQTFRIEHHLIDEMRKDHLFRTTTYGWILPCHKNWRMLLLSLLRLLFLFYCFFLLANNGCLECEFINYGRRTSSNVTFFDLRQTTNSIRSWTIKAFPPLSLGISNFKYFISVLTVAVRLS